MQEEQSLFTSEFDEAVEQAKQKKEQGDVQDGPAGNVHDVLIAPEPKLRKKAVPIETIGDEERQLVADMFETMYKSQGMGLASTQIGSDKRIIVMDVTNLSAYDEDVEQDIKTFGKFAIINPEIVQRTEQVVKWAEGCLSVPGFQFEIPRAGYVVVQGFDQNGAELQIRASGLLAACIQHEIDHLDGVLFIDHISRLKREMVIKKLKKLRKRGRMVVKAHNAPKL